MLQVSKGSLNMTSIDGDFWLVNFEPDIFHMKVIEIQSHNTP